MKHRSYLFVPGDRPERFAKACGAGADAVILDLEDAVAPEHKAHAREQVASWLESPPPLPVLVRINGMDSPWIDDDLAALRRSANLAAIMLPKAAEPADIDRVIGRLETRIPLIALIETAAGLINAYAIACHGAVERLAFGSLDFQLENMIDGGRDGLLYARSQVVIHSRAAGLAAPIDGVTACIDDPDRVLADTRHAQSLGFAGKLCIHPSQIASVHAGFRPTAQEFEWARGVLAAVESADGGAIRHQGKMIDLPVIGRARQILTLCDGEPPERR
jgi:citrate lyase subunit beta/citryl-CoA lyase